MRKLEELPNCMCFSLEHDDGVLYIAKNNNILIFQEAQINFKSCSPYLRSYFG